MAPIQKKASLHEKSVQKVARGEHVVPRKRRARGSSRNGPVSTEAMHPLIKKWMKKEGLRLTSPRVQVNSTEEIIVWNEHRPDRIA